MGRKVHPYGFRLGIIKDWQARWFADGQRYTELLDDDRQIRTLIRRDASSLLRICGTQILVPALMWCGCNRTFAFGKKTPILVGAVGVWKSSAQAHDRQGLVQARTQTLQLRLGRSESRNHLLLGPFALLLWGFPLHRYTSSQRSSSSLSS